jgi:ATP-binding cassette subfamily C (CFTR/MRP) protein 1
MNQLIQTIPALNAALAGFNRIRSFLKSDARKDHRLPLGALVDSSDQSSMNTTSDGIALKPLGLFTGRSELNSTMIAVQNASFSWTEGG